MTYRKQRFGARDIAGVRTAPDANVHANRCARGMENRPRPPTKIGSELPSAGDVEEEERARSLSFRQQKVVRSANRGILGVAR